MIPTNVQIIMGLSAAVLLGAPARADDLTPSVYSSLAVNEIRDESYALSANFTVTDAATSSSLMTDPGALAATGPGVPTLVVHAQSGDPGTGYATGAEAYVNFNYAYKVLGSTVPVPVEVAYTLEAANSFDPYNNVYSHADVLVIQQLYDDSNPYYNKNYVDFAQPGYTSKTVSGVFATMDNPDTANLVELQVKVITFGGPSMSSTAEAYADPYIYIDPAYLADHPKLTLEVSPGVGNLGGLTSPTPEPAAWAMMVGGFGLIGLMLRRSKPRVEQASGSL